ncbi:hypothetical protein V2J09_003323 [Rumex salicifolius]
MTVEQLEGSLQAYEERDIKKQETAEQLLKTQFKEKEENVRKATGKAEEEEEIVGEDMVEVGIMEAKIPTTTTMTKEKIHLEGVEEDDNQTQGLINLNSSVTIVRNTVTSQ